MVVHKEYSEAVTQVFNQLYDPRWPIQRMRLVDQNRGDDDRSMAANNTSGFNSRRVGGSDAWSAHAHGAAIDVNPVQNRYVTRSSIEPGAGSRFAVIDRSAHARVPAGAIRAEDVVVRVRPDRVGVGRRMVHDEGLPALLLVRRLSARDSYPDDPAGGPAVTWPFGPPARPGGSLGSMCSMCSM
jgi:hypothetical protein